jgi:hypothetical protein
MRGRGRPAALLQSRQQSLNFPVDTVRKWPHYQPKVPPALIGARRNGTKESNSRENGRRIAEMKKKKAKKKKK